MKKILLGLLALIVFTSVQAQTWNYVSSTGTTFILYGMSFAPGQSDIGYACGMQYTYDADGVIVKTTDGGDNWTQIHPTSGDIDGLQGISFINDTVGYACGWNNYFIKTTDGGATWTNETCGSNVWYYTDIDFWDDNNGAACAYMNSGSDACVFVTSDGGLTWTASTSGVTGTLMGLDYADQNTLFAVSTTTLYKSTDGGFNWTSQPSLPGLLFNVEFSDANFGVIGAEEKFHYTTNGGASWSTYTTGYENFYALKVFTDGSAYVGGTDENIYSTSDYGANWAMDHNGSGTSSLYRISYTPNGVLTTCGSQGTIIQRTPVLAAAFTADNTEVCEGDAVNFTDQSTGAPTIWNWTFEGGTPASSTAQNPSVTYNTSGTYDVTLYVSDGNLNNTFVETDYITVSAIPGQAATPTGPDEVCGGETVDYTTTAVSGADTYFWAVDPSDAGSITGSGTTGTFTAATDWTGSYSVKVRAENACGNGTYSAGYPATLYHNPVAYFLGGGGGYCIGGDGKEITLDGSETGIDYELFYEGNTTGIILAGTGSALSFGYFTDQGLYTAVGSNANCTQNMNGQPYISIIFMPAVPEIPAGPEVVCNMMVSTYTSTGSLNADELIWVLDPTNAGTLTTGTDMVEIEWDGSYIGTAMLSVYGSNECGDSDPSPELEITVNASPTPEISGAAIVCEDDIEMYSTDDNSGSTYEWTVDGGTITAGAGTHQITVEWGSYGSGFVHVAEDNGACVDSTENYVVQIDECTGVDELTMNDYKLYPNPANSMVTLEFVEGNSQGYNINIWNAHGKLMEERKVPAGENSTEINVSDFPSGIYFVELSTETATYNKIRFIVNH